MIRKNLVVLVCFNFLLILSSKNCFAGDTLVFIGSTWKYLDNGSNPDSNWTTLAYVDSTWDTGNAQFGYGDGDETTVVSFGPSSSNKYITTYFRQVFQVPNDSIYKGLQLFLKRDDGAVVYLNGIEVYRSNMPPDSITYHTLASNNVYGGAESVFIPAGVSKSALVSGDNIISVEVHQEGITDSDVSFDLCLIADSSVQIVRGPYLQIATPHSMTVRWRTSNPEISKVLFGLNLQYTDSLIDTSLVSDHLFNIQGLLPDTKYYYAVCSSNQILTSDSDTYFMTPPVEGTSRPVRIWTMGDMGNETIQQNQTRDAYYNYTDSVYTNLILMLGDNAYPDGNDEEYTTAIFEGHYENILKKTVAYSTCGNHELFSATSSNQTGAYYDIFSLPVNGESGGVPSGKEAYYSFNYANIHFVCLESNIDSFGQMNYDTMITWLTADLTANTQTWTIVFFHFPPYSKGYHDSDDNTTEVYLRTNMIPILESFNVDLVLGGHSHDYERTHLLKGHFGLSTTFDSTMIMDPRGGAPPDFYDKTNPADSGTVYAVVANSSEITPAQPDWPHPAMYKAFNTLYGSMVIDVNRDTMDVKFITSTDSIADHFVILKYIPVVIEPDTEILRGPYLQIATPNSMNVCWRSSLSEETKILYGTTLAYTDSLTDTTAVTDHSINITGLLPSAKYYYAVRLSDQTLHGDSSWYFYTAPATGLPQPVRIWTMGDMGTGNPQQDQVRDAYYNFTDSIYTNILLWLGNNAYNEGSDANYTANIFSGHYEDILRKSVVYSTCGKLELYNAKSADQSGDYYNIFNLPSNGEAGGHASNNEAYYSFNYSNIHFVCLESNIDSFGTLNILDMITWLEDDLIANHQKWTIVYYHYPPYTKGHDDSDSDPNMSFMRQIFNPIIESYNVDLVLSAHSNNYERSCLLKGNYGNSTAFNSSMIMDSTSGMLPLNYVKSTSDSGTVYAVIGSAGKLSPVQSSWPHPGMYCSLDTTYGSMAIDVNGDTLIAKFIDINGNIADNFSMVKYVTTSLPKLMMEPGKVFLYPDPANDELKIQFVQSHTSGFNITIINSHGKIVNSWDEKPVSSMLKKIDVSNYSSGLYFVRILSGSGVLVKKFIKE